MTRKVTELTFQELNTALLATEDVDVIRRWLKETVEQGVLYRALRIHGRLNGVRRQQELAQIRARCEKERAA